MTWRQSPLGFTISFPTPVAVDSCSALTVIFSSSPFFLSPNRIEPTELERESRERERSHSYDNRDAQNPTSSMIDRASSSAAMEDSASATAGPSSAVSGEVSGGGGVVAAADEDEDLCRICRGPSELGNPLRYPCACRGTIKYVHQECLLLWLDRRKISRCEACDLSLSLSLD